MRKTKRQRRQSWPLKRLPESKTQTVDRPPENSRLTSDWQDEYDEESDGVFRKRRVQGEDQEFADE